MNRLGGCRFLVLLAAVCMTGRPTEAATPRTDAAMRFRQQVQAFTDDLISAGADVFLAQRTAYPAVAEAWRWRLPPALLFGMMVTESGLDPHARSRIGALGLLQVRPDVWVPSLGRLYGTDLRDPETNVRYGAHVVAVFARRSGGRWDLTLQSYSGNARGYALKVMRAIKRYGRRQCPSGDLDACVGLPLYWAYSGGTP